MSVARHHAEWLSLVESSGPFISLPVLNRVFSHGLDPREPEQAKQLRLAYEEWQANPKFAGKQRAWIHLVLTQALGYPEELLLEGQTLPPALSATMAEYGETLRPDVALIGLAGGDLAGKPQLLIRIYDAEQALDKPVAEKHWKATPATRMMELLHAADVPLGLITNGEQWMLVFAPRGETTGFTTWLSSLWIDEPITLRAFLSLLSVRRFFGVAPKETLLELLKESASNQQEVTDQLGDQVRDAVEVLIQAFDQLDQGSDRILLKGVDEKSLYDSALTVMMRLVFLFSAEERGLLHLGKPIYDENYAVSTLREQLQEVADLYGEEVLERRNDAWARLLATFRAVHAGVNHQDLMLPSYGGSLFDPDRYPFLEGRPQGSRWHSKPAEPLEINNRVVLHLLKSLQMLQVRVPGGGPAEARRISFRALDIEQIGHIYEGLLDHTAVRAREVVIGLAASRKKPVASMKLSEMEKLRQQDETKLVEALEEETGKQAKSLEKSLKIGAPEEFHKILVACRQDQKLVERVTQFGGLLRQDSFERPVIVLPGGTYVGQGSARRSTGTHYTPRSLTEPIVQHTLEPLVYQGPAEGLPKEQWRLKSPKEILDLKVCDMAMGSGAFLVQACRYLSERLVESWENLEKEHPGEVLITPEGQFSQGEPSERLIPKDAVERLAIARRLVADRCIYGVDINPMAVEMAKLSIWLITVDKTRPFTFLDHALKCGDSLLGISRFKQLETFSLDDEHAKQVIILSNYDELIQTAIAKRRELEMLPSNDAAQIATKQTLLNEAEERMERLKLAADLLIAAELSASNDQKREMARAAAHMKVSQYIHKPIEDFRQFAHSQFEIHRTFHWPLEFPEIFIQDGFDAFMGNPPYLGGQKITGAYTIPYRHYLVTRIGFAKRGSADLCAYFLLRAASVMRKNGILGLVVTSALAEGDTREVGLQQLLTRQCTIIRCRTRQSWMGAANVTFVTLWMIAGKWHGPAILDDDSVLAISAFLVGEERESKAPSKLAANAHKSFQGSNALGSGFLMPEDQALSLAARNPKNRDVLLPFLDGADMNAIPDQKATRWAIYFADWPLDRQHAPKHYSGPVAADFPDCLAIVEAKVKPERAKNNDRRRRELWWQFTRPTTQLYQAIKNLDFCLAIATGATKYAAFGLISDRTLFSHLLTVIATDSYSAFAVLSSEFHDAWARTFGSYNLRLLRYTPSDVFETFPFPAGSRTLASSEPRLEEVGRHYAQVRSAIMTERREGLTSIYNRVHDPNEQSADICQFRAIYASLHAIVAAAYGWNDLKLDHGFHSTSEGLRYAICDSTRRTVIDRLLALNHERYEEEVRAGLHEKKASRKGSPSQDNMETAAAQGKLL
jgi:hypothetical protein